MVTLKYYRDPLTGECEVGEYTSVLEFLHRFENASELLDLRFFYDEIKTKFAGVSRVEVWEDEEHSAAYFK